MEEELIYFLDAQDEVFSDLEDGSWSQAMQDSVDLFNDENGTNYDPYETWLEWCKIKSSKQ